MKIVALAIIVLAFSGCFDSSEPSSTWRPPPIAMDSIRLTECTGGDAHMEAPEQTVTAPVPPGWEGTNGLPTTVRMFVLHCEHVSLGDFERGPIQVVIESHGKHSAPPNCRDGEYVFLNVLTRMIWSDQEIAQAMTNRLGIPTSVGTIVLPSVQDPAGVFSYQWMVDGATSSITLGRATNDFIDAEFFYRYVWDAGSKLGVIDWSWKLRQTWLEPTLATGSFSDPMILGHAEPKTFIGTGAVEERIDAGGKFKFYEGFTCEKPLS